MRMWCVSVVCVTSRGALKRALAMHLYGSATRTARGGGCIHSHRALACCPGLAFQALLVFLTSYAAQLPSCSRILVTWC